MNLCAITMRTHSNVRDDRPFSGPIKTYVPPFKGLKGGRNSSTSVTYRSNFFQDDLDDPELAFDNNNTFSYPDEPIYSELVFKSPQHPNGHGENILTEQMTQLAGSPPKCHERAKPPYPSPPSYKSHPCYIRANSKQGFPSSNPHPLMNGSPNGNDFIAQSPPQGCQYSPQGLPHSELSGFPELQFYDWDAVNMRQHRPDLSSDSDYFSTSTTYRANDNYKDGTSSSEQQSHLQTKLKSLSCELSTLSRPHPASRELNSGPGLGDLSRGELNQGPGNSSPGDSSGTMVVRPSPPLKYQQQNGSAPSLHHNGSHLQPSVFADEFSTLRSVRSHLTDASLQHNYSNISPRATSHVSRDATCVGHVSPLTSHHGPASIVSSNMSAVSAGCNGASFTPPLPTSQPPTEPLPPVPAPRTPPSERQRRRDRSLADEMRRSKLADISDLTRLQGPLTEDAVVKTLQARFYNNQYQTNVGPILLSINPYNDVGNPITLNSTKEAAKNSEAFYKVAQEAIRVQGETGYSQAIILSGACGSGKTYASMVLLRQLFDIAGGGPETDAFKHVAAAFSVLRSLGSAKTAANKESSRIGHFIEVQVSDGALYRTRLYCYSLDQSRVVRPLPTEKNYHIFYQMMAGLTTEERSALGLAGMSLSDLRYLNRGDIRTDVEADMERFNTWKANLVILGIPCMDVLKVMAAILLLGNINFMEGNGGLELDMGGKEELKSVAGLVGVAPGLLLQGLTTRTHNVRGHLVKSSSDAHMANSTRDALAKALYCRTVATIVKRANSLKRPALSGSMSSNESVHHEVASLHASTVGTAGSKKSSKSLAILSQAMRHATDGFIGILDMFGFEDSKPSQLEQLCINLCSETMQHFYNTHTLKTAIETCKDEGISCGVEVDYADNAHCIDLISSLRTGLLKMLDVECSVRGCPETYVQKVKVQQKDNLRLFEPQHCDTTRMFGIQHYAGKVVYDTSDFLETNRDVIPDDLVSIFHKHSCNFGFATHLFGTEIKALFSEETVPRGVTFRISPTSSSDLLNGDEPVSTLTQDFHTRLDNLLRTLVKSKPHFIRCIRPNETEASNEFSRSYVINQVRSLQVLETVNLMAGGLPHRMRFKNFNSRYRLLAPIKNVSRKEELAFEECHQILEFLRKVLEQPLDDDSPISKDWALGKKHVFLSEGTRQHLERLRTEKRNYYATLIQSIWRGRLARKKWPNLRRNLQSQQVMSTRPKTNRPRPQPISGTPPPEGGAGTFSTMRDRPLPVPSEGNFSHKEQILGMQQHHQQQHVDRCDFRTIQKTCALFGLDLERPPPVPPSRAYTVKGDRKISYPQNRVMRLSFPEDNSGPDVMLRQGENVVVLGASTRRGHLVVERNNHTIHVPYHYLELRGQS